LSYIEAADLVVGMAGYNTTMEILRSGRRTILIPRAGPSAEQRMRTRLFAARGWIDMIDPDDLSIETVAPTVLANLACGPRAGGAVRPDMSGLTVAVDELLDLLPDRTEALLQQAA
jgi:predicted glycosyltransferase